LVQRVDGFQRRHPRAGLPIAVIYKFADDQGNYLAALITYYGFLSLFPLLLLSSTILGFVLSGHPHLQQQVLDSALGQVPIVGAHLTSPHGATGSGVGIAIGILGTIYGGLGVTNAAQNAMNTIWRVPRNKRPNPITPGCADCCCSSSSDWLRSERPHWRPPAACSPTTRSGARSASGPARW
jgi:uncharacterized BrkB/YihY/UPF0761 family membrane protein